ncbi:MAG TPA: CHRD domain-containing protein [Gaiellaceae bacterium]|nr:CHRD domain-containing protein [Gaiellaceae bacterium]
MRKLTGIGIATAAGLLLVGVAIAGMNGNRSAHLTGAAEVPVRDTQAQGQAIFQLSQDGMSIDYKLNVANIENVFMAHIHQGAAGVNGGVGVWLYPSTTPNAPGPVGAGRIDGRIATGTFDAGDFVGPFAGMTVAQVWALIEGGGAYVNVHTNDGVDPTNTGPGDFPGGEIRADL